MQACSRYGFGPCSASGSSSLALGVVSIGPPQILVLISTTFLCEFECRDGTKVGLAAGRYSGNNRPDLYRTPHALHRDFGPMGPALHWGVFVISQCMHFRTACCVGGSSSRFSSRFGGRVILIFFFFFCSPSANFGTFTGGDSAKFSESDEIPIGTNFRGTSTGEGEMSWMAALGLKVAGRGRLLRARCGPRWLGLSGIVFPPEEELLLLLLLSKTEMGLEVLNWLSEGSVLMHELSFAMVIPPPENESSTKVESHSSCTISSYW